MSVKCPKCGKKILGEKKEKQEFVCAAGCQAKLIMKKVRFGDGPFDVELRCVERE